MLAYSKFPDRLFAGSPEQIQMVREAILRAPGR